MSELDHTNLYNRIRQRIEAASHVLPDAIYDLEQSPTSANIYFLDCAVLYPIAVEGCPADYDKILAGANDRKFIAQKLFQLAPDYSTASTSFLAVSALSLIELLELVRIEVSHRKSESAAIQRNYSAFVSLHRETIEKLERDPSMRGPQVAALLSGFDRLLGFTVLKGLGVLISRLRNKTLLTLGDAFDQAAIQDAVGEAASDREAYQHQLMQYRGRHHGESEQHFTMRNAYDSGNMALIKALKRSGAAPPTFGPAPIRTERSIRHFNPFFTGPVPQSLMNFDGIGEFSRSSFVPLFIYHAFAEANANRDIMNEANLLLNSMGIDVAFLVANSPKEISRLKDVSPIILKKMNDVYRGGLEKVFKFSAAYETLDESTRNVERMLTIMGSNDLKGESTKSIDSIWNSLAELDRETIQLTGSDIIHMVDESAKPYLGDILDRLNQQVKPE